MKNTSTQIKASIFITFFLLDLRVQIKRMNLILKKINKKEALRTRLIRNHQLEV